jgi:hypothetical protein
VTLKGGHLRVENRKYYDALTPDRKAKLAQTFYEHILDLADLMPESDNLFVTVGMTRRRDKYAVILNVNGLTYGGYSPDLHTAITTMLAKINLWHNNQADDYNQYPDGSDLLQLEEDVAAQEVEDSSPHWDE